MGKLIDVDEIKKMYPIMENDFGMVVNESLHKNLDKIPSAEAISKADMIDILDKIKSEIEQSTSRYSISKERGGMGQVEWSDRLIKESDVFQIIDKYKEEKDNG